MTTRQTLSARMLPEIRAELVQWLADTGPEGGQARWAQGFDPHTAREERQAAADWAVALRAAELFFVSKDMTRMAVSAGLALPSYRLHPEDLPATHGLLLWEEYATDSYEGGEYTGCPIIGVSWAQQGSGVQFRTWCLREDWVTFMAKGDPRAGLKDLTPTEVRALRMAYPQQIVCMSRGFLPFGKVPGWLSSMPDDTSGMALAELEDHSRSAGRQEQAERALVVTWLLMGQTLAREEETAPSKASAKHLRRIDPGLLTSVRYVRLRHAGAASQVGGNGGGRAYQHRWIVRGHWRNHWYPSRQSHRPIWIDSHVKGPDGAPILDPDKLVNVLRR
ncbi:hypothetical protein HZZ00_37895 (plasmid) [Streptomyces sp. NEAU-sy36]|uniref:hypothetical protein n=1 Tax=unclassified Streptomyces TaxID=2593676 RepID=UPI0015D655A2|nr:MULTISPECIES: hypothetical protein [unclassified Streptomyces]QLJ06804.1 hypothetical protein HZZ00_37895 [Streptomyces sp. NEAU-sy36]